MKIINYLKQIWENRKLIFEGIYNVFFTEGEKKEIAIERAMICKTCPHLSKNIKEQNEYYHPLNSQEGKLYPVPFKHCTLCGCSIAIKTFSMEAECPKKFWLSENI